jgi:hypothetical protein
MISRATHPQEVENLFVNDELDEIFGLGKTDKNDSRVAEELEPEIERFIALRKIISKLDFNQFFWTPKHTNIFPLGFSSNEEAANYIVPQRTKEYLNDIPYLSYFIDISGELFDIVKTNKNRYPNLYKGLGFLSTLKRRIDSNDFIIRKTVMFNTEYYYSGAVAYESTIKTKELWENIFDLLIKDFPDNTNVSESLINESDEILSIRELALNISETMGGDAYTYYLMLSRAFNHSGNDGTIDTYRKITGITLESMSRGKFRFV